LPGKKLAVCNQSLKNDSHAFIIYPASTGSVCGVQSSIQACFATASFLAGIFLRRPEDFWALQLASLCVVGSALLLYCCYMAGQITSRSASLVASESLSGALLEESQGLARSASEEFPVYAESEEH
jgi:hypothetical protein